MAGAGLFSVEWVKVYCAERQRANEGGGEDVFCFHIYFHSCGFQNLNSRLREEVISELWPVISEW
jgi:hypothetical protein